MFRVNEAKHDKGILSVKNGKMNIHVSLSSKRIVKLYPGFAEDAKNNENEWLNPSQDLVTYDDGFSETVYGFDIPVKFLDKEFNIALLGKKGVWYNHKVSVSLDE